MNVTDSFPDFWRRMQAGDPEAVAQIVKSLEPRIRRRARNLLRAFRIPLFYNEEDTCQWVLGHLLAPGMCKKIALGSMEELTKYVFTMTRNRVISLGRRHRAESNFQKTHPVANEAVMEAIPSAHADLSETSYRKEILERIRQQYPEEEWNLLLSRFSGKSWQAIAVKEASTPEALRKRFTRLVERIKEKFICERAA